MGALPEGGLSPSDRKRVPWSLGLRDRMGTGLSRGSGLSVIFWNISPGPSLPPSWPIFYPRDGSPVKLLCWSRRGIHPFRT